MTYCPMNVKALFQYSVIYHFHYMYNILLVCFSISFHMSKFAILIKMAF